MYCSLHLKDATQIDVAWHILTFRLFLLWTIYDSRDKTSVCIVCCRWACW